jgi:hypothetical protein
MEPNEKARETIFEIIENQIEANEPPETKRTYQRLIDLGYNEFVTKQLIGQCLAVELFGIMKYHEPFNETRYIKNLRHLPKEPH